jgi:hypothetical protein
MFKCNCRSVSRHKTVSKHKVAVYFSLTHRGMSSDSHRTPRVCSARLQQQLRLLFACSHTPYKNGLISYAESVNLCHWSQDQGNFHEDCCLPIWRGCSLERSTDVSEAAAGSCEMSIHIYQTARRRVQHDNLHRYRQKNRRHHVAFKFNAAFMPLRLACGYSGQNSRRRRNQSTRFIGVGQPQRGART